jgi:hypothetical protein
MIILAFAVAIKLKAKQDPEASLQAIGDGLVKDYHDYRARMRALAVKPQKYFEEGYFTFA